MAEKLTVGEMVYKISGDMDNLKTELKRSDAEVKKLKNSMEKAGKATAVTSKSFLKGSIVISIWNKGLQLARSLLTATIRNASDLTESINAVNVVFKDGADKILEYGRNAANSVGLATAEYNQLATITGALLKDSGKSMDEVAEITNDLTVRAADMASVFNTDVKDALSAVNQALRGETEAIRRYAGDVTDATLQTFLNSKGIKENVKDLTEQEKRLRRVDLIMEQTKDTAGDFANTSGSLANQQRIVTARFKNTTAAIGTALLPSLNQLGKVFIKTESETKDNSESMDSFGRVIFRITGIVTVLGLTIANLGNATKIAWNLLQNAFVGGGAVVLKAMQLVMKGLGKDTTTIDIAISDLADSAKKNFDDMGDAIDNMKENSEKITEALDQVFDPDAYDTLKDKLAGETVALEEEAVAAEEAEKALEKERLAAEKAADAAEEMKKETEGVVGSLISLRDEAVKTREELENQLAKTFEDFGAGIKENFDESVTSLAEVVLAAEEARKNIKEALKDKDLTSAQRKELKAELKQQEEILKSREDFEERQADKVVAIRERLEEAGIDAAKAGLDGLLDVRSLEEQLEEDRRIASLDEFQRLEEEQSRKLTAIVDAFITEATLLKEKIEKQKEFEQEITDFLLNEDEKRLANTQAWAADTLTEYGKLASSLRSLISQQQTLNALRGQATTSSRSTPTSTRNSNNSSVVNNSKVVNAPINISGGQSVADPGDLGKEIAWELNRS